MSRWLKNVNALLENLDNQVEETVEEHRFNREHGEGIGDESAAVATSLLQKEALGVEDILAKRGLLSSDEDEEIDENANVGTDIDNLPTASSGNQTNDTPSNIDVVPLEGVGVNTDAAKVDDKADNTD